MTVDKIGNSSDIDGSFLTNCNLLYSLHSTGLHAMFLFEANLGRYCSGKNTKRPPWRFSCINCWFLLEKGKMWNSESLVNGVDYHLNKFIDFIWANYIEINAKTRCRFQTISMEKGNKTKVKWEKQQTLFVFEESWFSADKKTLEFLQRKNVLWQCTKFRLKLPNCINLLKKRKIGDMLKKMRWKVS